VTIPAKPRRGGPVPHVPKRNPNWLTTTTARFETRASTHTYLFSVWLVLSDAVENFIANNDQLRAAALTYTVALSIVPILALAFSVLKGFGEENTLRPLIERYLAVGGVSEQLMGYIQNVNAAALGSAGGAFLLLTVISTMGTVEQALNTIFHAPQSRSYLRKFSDYLSVLFTVPLLITAALAVTAVFSVRISRIPLVTSLMPYMFIWAGFFFLFVFFPYTKVRYVPALIGSFVTAILFQLAQWGYIRFQVGVANYRAIYGAVATIPIFLVWIYVAWSVVLFGAEVTAAVQRGVQRPSRHPLSPDFPFAAALHVLVRLAERHARGGDPITAYHLAHDLGVPEAALAPILDGLEEGGLVVEAADGQGLFLVRDPSTILLADAMACVVPDLADGDRDPRVGRVLGRLSEARSEVLKSITLAQLAAAPASADAALAARPAEASV